MRIIAGNINISVGELANMLVAVSEDAELQKEILDTANRMEQFCNALGTGDEEPVDSATEDDFRYEIVGTYIDYATQDYEDEDIEVDEYVYDAEEDDDDIPF